MKQVVRIILAAAAVAVMAVPAMSADKLIVKNTGVTVGATNAHVVSDQGKSGFNTDAPLWSVDVQNYNNVANSQLHFSNSGAQNGGWLTSAGENNFFLSSGAVYEGGAWKQKATTGNSVFFGTGSTGFSAYLNSGATVDGPVTANLVMRIGYTGNMGVGVATAQQKVEVNGGIRLNTATVQPACAATTSRGTFWVVQGAAGTKDSVQVCAKDAADVYAWRTIY